MRISRMCPKCECDDILTVEDTPGFGYWQGNVIKVNDVLESVVVIKRLVCCNCGYTEEWVPQYDIERLKKTYGKEK